MYLYATAMLGFAPLALGAKVDTRAGPKVLAGAPVNDLRVSSDNVVQCAQATISWTGATNPVTVQVGTGGYYVGTTWLQTFDSVSSDSQTWTVTQPSGTDLIFQITDAKGQVAYQQNVNVGDSSDSSCLVDSGASEAPASSTWSSAAAETSSAWSDAASSTSTRSRTKSAASSAPSSTASSAAAAADAPSSSSSSSSKAAKSSKAADAPASSKAASASSSQSAAAAGGASPASASPSASSAVSAAPSSASSTSAPAGNATLAAAESTPTSGAGVGATFGCASFALVAASFLSAFIM